MFVFFSLIFLILKTKMIPDARPSISLMSGCVIFYYVSPMSLIEIYTRGSSRSVAGGGSSGPVRSALASRRPPAAMLCFFSALVSACPAEERSFPAFRVFPTSNSRSVLSFFFFPSRSQPLFSSFSLLGLLRLLEYRGSNTGGGSCRYCLGRFSISFLFFFLIRQIESTGFIYYIHIYIVWIEGKEGSEAGESLNIHAWVLSPPIKQRRGSCMYGRRRRPAFHYTNSIYSAQTHTDTHAEAHTNKD